MKDHQGARRCPGCRAEIDTRMDFGQYLAYKCGSLVSRLSGNLVLQTDSCKDNQIATLQRRLEKLEVVVAICDNYFDGQLALSEFEGQLEQALDAAKEGEEPQPI